MIYGWYFIAVIILALIIELFTKQHFAIWFVPGAVFATAIDFFYPELLLEIVVCLGVAAVGIILSKFVFNKTKGDVRTNIDAIIGEKCVVTEKIDNFAGCGQARVGSQIWSARGSSETDSFEVGEVLSVVAIEGVKLICKK